jgi:hypothetical protein
MNELNRIGASSCGIPSRPKVPDCWGTKFGSAKFGSGRFGFRFSKLENKRVRCCQKEIHNINGHKWITRFIPSLSLFNVKANVVQLTRNKSKAQDSKHFPDTLNGEHSFQTKINFFIFILPVIPTIIIDARMNGYNFPTKFRLPIFSFLVVFLESLFRFSVSAAILALDASQFGSNVVRLVVTRLKQINKKHFKLGKSLKHK